MERTPIKERKLPNYTKGEEIANMVTHIVGGAVGIVILLISLQISISHRNVWGIVSGSIFGFSVIALYTVSSVYHGLKCCTGKKVMQVIDHCTIYLLIVGTYTPILLSGIRPAYPVIAWTVFGVEWALALAAATFTAIDLSKYKKLSMICYLGMGWCIVAVLKQTINVMTLRGFLMLLSGGIAYTVGAVLYKIGAKKPIFHTVFHVLTVVGTTLQAIAIFGYVL